LNSFTKDKLESEDAKLVDKAGELMDQNELVPAIKLLKQVISNTPIDYSNEYEINNTKFIKFWDKNQFVHFVTWKRQFEEVVEVDWIPNAYPKACFYMGCIYSHKKQFEAALPYLSKGYLLEPTNPLIVFELAYAHLALGNTAQSIKLFNKVNKESEYVSGRDYAKSLRGKGIALIDLGNLDRAEYYLLESLKGDPGNQLAHDELLYISQLRNGGKHQAVNKLVTSDLVSVECKYCQNIQDLSIHNVDGESFYICPQCEGKNGSPQVSRHFEV